MSVGIFFTCSVSVGGDRFNRATCSPNPKTVSEAVALTQANDLSRDQF